MPIISVRIPQLGEGLQEALLVEFIARPGDVIKRDDPIYVMETDKATTDVESPYDGKLIEWTVEEGNVLSIGTEVAKMEVVEGVQEMNAGHGTSPTAATADSPANDSPANDSPAKSGSGSLARETSAVAADLNIPPRTRKYLKDHGLLDVAAQIPFTGSKLMPADVDRFLAEGGVAADNLIQSGNLSSDAVTQTPAAEVSDADPDQPFTDHSVSKVQQTLNFRMHRGAQACVQVTMMKEVDWTAITAAREVTRKQNGESAFTMLLWCVVQAMNRHDKFRSSLISSNTLRTFEHAQLGIAVGLPDDVLVTAVIKQADTLSRSEFNKAVARQVAIAREGTDQANAATTFTVSNIGGQSIRWGIPAIVSPAVATLAVGEVFDKPVPVQTDTGEDSFEFRKTVQLVLAFDHRVANGVGAAEFLNDIADGIENFTL